MLKLAALLVGLAILAVVAARMADAYTPTPTETDVNRDGVVNLLDLAQVALHFGQAVPTPTPLPGGGAERVVAHDLVVEPTGNWVDVGSVDTATCPGAVFYLSAQSSDPTLATLMDVRVNGLTEGGTLQVEPSPTTFLVHDFNVGGTSVLQSNLNWGGANPTTLSVRVNASLFAIKLTLEAHCQPGP